MEHGLSLLNDNAVALGELCRRFHVQRLEVFGSAANGKFDPTRSDLDFIVRFAEMPPGSYANNYFGLLEALEALFGRPVDLVPDSRFENPFFQRRVESERKPVFEAPP